MEMRQTKRNGVQICLVCVVLLLAVSLLGCRNSEPQKRQTAPRISGAQMELNRLRPQLDGIALWIGENRDSLQETADTLLSQQDTTRNVCSDGGDPNVLVRISDGRFINGRESEIKAWAGDFEELVRKQRDLLRKAGCQGFTWDNDGFLKLFLRPNVFVAIPDPDNAFVDPVANGGSGLLFERRKWIDHYRSWAEKGSDHRGDFCRQLPGDWFLCTERR